MSASITEIIDVATPIEQTFAYIADFGNLSEWDPSFDESRRLDDGALGIGSKFEVATKWGPVELKIPYLITEFERPTRVRLVGTTPRFTSDDVIEFSELPDGGTRVTYKAKLDTKLPDFLDVLGTPGFWLLGKVVGKSMRDKLSQPDALEGRTAAA